MLLCVTCLFSPHHSLSIYCITVSHLQKKGLVLKNSYWEVGSLFKLWVYCQDLFHRLQLSTHFHTTASINLTKTVKEKINLNVFHCRGKNLMRDQPCLKGFSSGTIPFESILSAMTTHFLRKWRGTEAIWNMKYDYEKNELIENHAFPPVCTLMLSKDINFINFNLSSYNLSSLMLIIKCSISTCYTLWTVRKPAYQWYHWS